MMSLVLEGRPSDSPLVEMVWRTRSEDAGSFMSSAVVGCEIVMVKYQGKTSFFVRGPETRASLADYPADVEFFGIRFKPGVFMPYLLPKNLADRRDVLLPEATSQSFWLNGSAWQFPDYENADTFVNRLAREGLVNHDPIVNTVLQGRTHDLSLRALQYRFLRATGVTQSVFHQIERAQHAASLLQQGIPILDTVFKAGYFDQAHLTRSMRRFMGQTPAQILRLPERV